MLSSIVCGVSAPCAPFFELGRPPFPDSAFADRAHRGSRRERRQELEPRLGGRLQPGGEPAWRSRAAAHLAPPSPARPRLPPRPATPLPPPLRLRLQGFTGTKKYGISAKEKAELREKAREEALKASGK